MTNETNQDGLSSILGEQEASVVEPSQTAETPPQQSQPSWEEMQGKVASLEKQLADAQSFIGQQTAEVAAARAAMSAPQQKEPDPFDISDEDLFSKPKETLSKFAEGVTKPLNDRVEELQQQLVIQQFRAKHPDVDSVITSQEFMNFAQQGTNPYLYHQATNLGDMNAADMLITAFKESQNLRKAETQATVNSVASEGVSASVEGSLNRPISERKYVEAKQRGVVFSPEEQRAIDLAFQEGNVIDRI